MCIELRFAVLHPHLSRRGPEPSGVGGGYGMGSILLWSGATKHLDTGQKVVSVVLLQCRPKQGMLAEPLRVCNTSEALKLFTRNHISYTAHTWVASLQN